MTDPHKTIYLQRCTDGETTWSEDKINDDDTEYVLGSECDALQAKIDAFIAHIQELEAALDEIELVARKASNRANQRIGGE